MTYINNTITPSPIRTTLPPEPLPFPEWCAHVRASLMYRGDPEAYKRWLDAEGKVCVKFPNP